MNKSFAAHQFDQIKVEIVKKLVTLLQAQCPLLQIKLLAHSNELVHGSPYGLRQVCTYNIYKIAN